MISQRKGPKWRLRDRGEGLEKFRRAELLTVSWISTQRQKAFKTGIKTRMREQGSPRKCKSFRWSLTCDMWGFGGRRMSVTIDCLGISEGFEFYVKECALNSDGN